MFKVKICGITEVTDVNSVIDSGADAMGLNFCDDSIRHVSPDKAATIVDAVGRRLLVVGVFVNHAVDEIRRILETVALDAVQLHGDEPLTAAWEVLGLPLVKAIRFETDTKLEEQPWLRENPEFLRAALIDASIDGQYGGTGQSADWDSLAVARGAVKIPLILAGGLNPANVAEAIGLVQPAGVDVASGVESAPGRKDATRVAEFVKHATQALDRIPGR